MFRLIDFRPPLKHVFNGTGLEPSYREFYFCDQIVHSSLDSFQH